MSRAWYTYSGTGSPTLPENYFYSFGTPFCNSGRRVCAIYGVYGGPWPFYISFNIQNYIAAGMSTGLAQPMFPIGAKKYVYFLP